MSPGVSISDPEEVRAFIQQLPLAVDRERFTQFVLGFPRRYLHSTPPVEIVKHYALMESLGGKPVVSSVSREGKLWKASIIARDRRALFSRIAGTLSCHGMNIVSAEAFANANALVLDTFRFVDRDRSFDDDARRRSFQVFLEAAVEGKTDIESRLKKRLEEARFAPLEALEVRVDQDAHPTATRLTLNCRDHFGLLYVVTRCIAEEGYNIEIAYIETPGDRVADEFYVTCDGAKLTADQARELAETLAHLEGRDFSLDLAVTSKKAR